jgi:RES domain-containing protein
MRYCGTLYRALNPVYTREPLSGQGAALHGGRFNPKGTAALYLSLAVTTALREANQAGSLQPTTLVSYDADIDGIVDSRDEEALARHGMDRVTLADAAWRDRMRTDGRSRTQVFALGLITQGYRGLLVRGFAPGATADDLNLVLWRWGDAAPERLTLIDDEGRLSRQGAAAPTPSPPP